MWIFFSVTNCNAKSDFPVNTYMQWGYYFNVRELQTIVNHFKNRPQTLNKFDCLHCPPFYCLHFSCGTQIITHFTSTPFFIPSCEVFHLIVYFFLHLDVFSHLFIFMFIITLTLNSLRIYWGILYSAMGSTT